MLFVQELTWETTSNLYTTQLSTVLSGFDIDEGNVARDSLELSGEMGMGIGGIDAPLASSPPPFKFNEF